MSSLHILHSTQNSLEQSDSNTRVCFSDILNQPAFFLVNYQTFTVFQFWCLPLVLLAVDRMGTLSGLCPRLSPWHLFRHCFSIYFGSIMRYSSGTACLFDGTTEASLHPLHAPMSLGHPQPFPLFTTLPSWDPTHPLPSWDPTHPHTQTHTHAHTLFYLNTSCVWWTGELSFCFWKCMFNVVTF